MRRNQRSRNVLLGGNLGHVLAELLFAFASIARSPLRFDYSKDGAIDVIEAEVGETVPGRRIIALDGDLELHLCVVREVPARAL